MNGPLRLAIVIPVLDDWDCLKKLIGDFPNPEDLDIQYTFFIVDDGSRQPAPGLLQAKCAQGSRLIRLNTNLGHQRAIAVGLVEACSSGRYDAIAVMDSDGEDRPADLRQLLVEHREFPSCIIVAKRGQRSERFSFKISYWFFRKVFRCLTGKSLDFGNFVILPKEVCSQLIQMPELWNHFPATVMRTGIDIRRLSVDRGQRYAGRSRMNFVALVNHGLSAVSVFLDRVFTRLLVGATALIVVLALVAALGVITRILIQNAIPGWAALSITVATVVAFQVVIAVLLLGFLNLSARSTYSPPVSLFASRTITWVRDFGASESEDD